MCVQQDFQLFFQSEEGCFFQTGSICPDIAAIAVPIGSRMAEYIKPFLLGDLGEGMVAAAAIGPCLSMGTPLFSWSERKTGAEQPSPFETVLCQQLPDGDRK